MSKILNADGTPMAQQGLVVLPNKRPFDRHRGELIGELGPDFVIVPVSKWADTPLLDEALDLAVKVFTRRATNTTVPNLRLDDETILIQEYRRQDRIAVMVAAWGRQMGMRHWNWLYHTSVFRLTPQMKQALILAGRWQESTLH